LAPGEEGRGFFRNSFSISSSLIRLFALASSFSWPLMPEPVLPSFPDLDTQWPSVFSLRPSSLAHSLIDLVPSKSGT
jgi:hypothetical protein